MPVPPPKLPVAPRRDLIADALPSPGELFDGMLTFNGPENEFAMLLLTSVFTTRLLPRAVIFQLENRDGAPRLLGALPPLPDEKEPEWLKTVIAALPANDSRTRIIPRGMADDRPSMPTRLGIKSLDPGGAVYLAFEMKRQSQAELPAFMMNLDMLGALWRSFRRRADGSDAGAIASAVSLMSVSTPTSNSTSTPCRCTMKWPAVLAATASPWAFSRDAMSVSPP